VQFHLPVRNTHGVLTLMAVAAEGEAVAPACATAAGARVLVVGSTSSRHARLHAGAFAEQTGTLLHAVPGTRTALQTHQRS
jgi:hypothetical protein